MKLKSYFVFVLFLISFRVQTQNLSPEEQRQLLEDMKVMKEKIHNLERNKPSGLKTINYENETAETKEKAPGDPGAAAGSLNPEQAKKLMEDINALKTRQSEAQKILEEMDKEEQGE